MSMRLLIVVPAYNEEPTIADLLVKIRAVELSGLGIEKEVVVVDDGSTDRTAELVAAGFSEVRLIRQGRRRGKGSAVRAALDQSHADLVIVQDADLEYDPADYPRLLAPIVREAAQVVYGSRFLSSRYPRKMLFWNFVGNVLGTAITNLLYGSRLTDLMTCYKVMPLALMKELKVEACGFEICPEVTAKILKKGIAIREVPIAYRGRSKREGKKIVFWDSVRIVKVLVRERLKK